MKCKHCGKEIMVRGFDWVHSQPPFRYRCATGPAPDPQTYAEPMRESDQKAGTL